MKESTVVTRERAVAGAVLVTAVVVGWVSVGNRAAGLALPLLLAGGTLPFVRPTIGLFLIVGLFPVEAAVMVGGRSAAALIGMAVLGVWAA